MTRADKTRECNKKWRLANPDKVGKAQKRFRLAHPERVRAWKKKMETCKPRSSKGTLPKGEFKTHKHPKRKIKSEYGF